ncbi:MAG TPA: SCO family protein [Bryobacteraceae bacterium]|nr:SCO family protein [Bryobacteraceae bacterium]
MKWAVLAGLLAFGLISCSKQSSSLQVYYDVPEFHLVAQDGQPFDSQALAGKIWVADFIYTTCPGPCPRMTSQMRQVQDAIEKMPDVKLVSFTVDPARDTPAVLAGYAKAHGAAAERWYFLTGAVATLQTLDRDVFKLGNLDALLEHSTRFVLVDRKSRIRGYYETSESQNIPKLIGDIYSLAREKG